MSVTVNSLINHGYLPPSKNFHGPWSSKAPKLLLGVTIGYTIGQVSKNLTKMKQKFIILEYEHYFFALPCCRLLNLHSLNRPESVNDFLVQVFKKVSSVITSFHCKMSVQYLFYST
jgi:hypothetical protein